GYPQHGLGPGRDGDGGGQRPALRGGQGDGDGVQQGPGADAGAGGAGQLPGPRLDPDGLGRGGVGGVAGAGAARDASAPLGDPGGRGGGGTLAGVTGGGLRHGASAACQRRGRTVNGATGEAGCRASAASLRVEAVRQAAAVDVQRLQDLQDRVHGQVPL